MSTVKAHRLVNSELKDVIKDIHGLQVSPPLPCPAPLWLSLKVEIAADVALFDLIMGVVEDRCGGLIPSFFIGMKQI